MKKTPAEPAVNLDTNLLALLQSRMTTTYPPYLRRRFVMEKRK